MHPPRHARAALALVVGASLLLATRYMLAPSPPGPTQRPPLASVITTASTMSTPSTVPTPPPPARQPPASYTQAMLSVTRAMVDLEMLHYNYSRSGARSLADLQPTAGGTPLRSLILSTWRSGSSFLGHLLGSSAANIYFFEPMFVLDKIRQIRKPAQTAKAFTLLRNLMKCKHDTALTQEYFRWISKHVISLSAYWHVMQLWSRCSPDSACYEPDFLSNLYQLFPIQIFKLVRIRLHLIQDLLRDDDLNLRIVLLVRDPRAVMYSRVKIDDFCSDDAVDDCEDPGVLCRDMERDYATAARLQRTAPGRLMVLRFEDLALNLDATAEQLFQFLQLDLNFSVRSFIQTHTNESNPKPTKKDHYTTYRNTKEVPFQWKKDVDFSIIKQIQSACSKCMSMWGYAPAHNASHLTSDQFVPVTSYSITPPL